MWVLWAGAAMAGPLRIAAVEGGTAEVLPRAVPGRIDVLVRPVSPDLRNPPLPPPDGIRAVRVTDLGGTAVVTLWPIDAAARGVVTRSGGNWEVSTTSGPADGPASSAPASDFEGDPGCGSVPLAALVILHGADMLNVFLPSDFAPVLPRWAPGETRDSTWSEVAELRIELSRTPTTGLRAASERAPLLYQLGAMHRDLGYAREAAYYFRAAQGFDLEPGLSGLQLAGALLQARDWEAARAAAAEAVRRGAPEGPALEIEGIAALFSENSVGPAPGMALDVQHRTPDASLVAGALLLKKGCYENAVAPLQRALSTPNTGRLGMAHLLLADALLLSGDNKGADAALQDLRAADIPARWRGTLRARSRLAAMLREPPPTWPAMTPTLHRIARQRDSEGADALFILGQIGEHLGDERLALESYAALVDRWRPLARGEPGLRLHKVWSRRTASLLREGNSTEALAVHAGFWRPQIVRWLDDPAPLAAIAEGYAALNLYDPALDILRVIASVEGERKLDDRATILAIARAYEATERLVELSDTLDFLAGRPEEPSITGQARLLRGRLHERRGQPEDARAVLATVATPPAAAAEASRRIALIDADSGRCDLALPVLLRDVEPGVAPGAPVLLAARARCLLASGETEAGRAAARRAGETLTDPASASALKYLAGELSPDAPPDVWARIARSDTAWETLRARVEKKASTLGPAAR